MTNKKAVKILTLERDNSETNHCTPLERKVAFNMAISALMETESKKQTQEWTFDSRDWDFL